MRHSSDLLFAGNEYHRCLWRAVGGQRWTTLTSILVVIWDPSDQNAVTHQLSEHSILHPLCNMGLFFQSINQSMIQSIIQFQGHITSTGHRVIVIKWFYVFVPPPTKTAPSPHFRPWPLPSNRAMEYLILINFGALMVAARISFNISLDKYVTLQVKCKILWR